jgi:hypothetical protein
MLIHVAEVAFECIYVSGPEPGEGRQRPFKPQPSAPPGLPFRCMAAFNSVPVG